MLSLRLQQDLVSIGRADHFLVYKLTSSSKFFFNHNTNFVLSVIELFDLFDGLIKSYAMFECFLLFTWSLY